MNELKDIAKEALVSGVGRRRNIRMLSTGYLALHGRVDELEKKIMELQGGESIERKVPYADSCIDRNTDCSGGLLASVYPEYDAVNKLLGFGLVSAEYFFGHSIIKGPEQHMKSFLFLTKTISKLIQDAYNEGFEDGKKTIGLLASGKITLKELNNRALRDE